MEPLGMAVKRHRKVNEEVHGSRFCRFSQLGGRG